MKRPLVLHFMATVCLLSFTAAGLRFAAARTPGSLAHQLHTIPQTIAGWKAVSDRALPGNVLDTLKATSYLQRFYRRGHMELELFIAYYAEQRAGESIHTPKHCLPGGGWEIAEIGTAPVRFGRADTIVNKYIVELGTERLLILYWYHSKSRVVANEYAAKLYLARDSILRGNTDGAIVRITLKDQPGALKEAVAFAADLLPDVQTCFVGESAPKLVRRFAKLPD